MKEHLENILRCPITKGTLRKMSMNEIKEVNHRISNRELVHFDGMCVNREIREGFVSSNGQFAYPVEEQIIILLEARAVVLDEAGVNRHHQAFFPEEKANVQSFYDQIGWQKGEGEIFVDTLLFEDLRPVSHDYRHKCHMRVMRYIKPNGRYILDVASGPIPHPEYLIYSSGYDFHICIDFSIVALQEARRKLGDKGIYILGDITNLPLQDNVVDAVVSLHTIYHVPEYQQLTVFQEIIRVVKPGCSAVVVYSWGQRSFLIRLPFKLLRAATRWLWVLRSSLLGALRRKGYTDGTKKCGPPWPDLSKLYFYTHKYEWFNKQMRNSHDFELLVWSSVNTPFLETCIHPRLLGRQALELIYWFEERFPHVAGRLGEYPMFVFRK